MRVLLDTHVFIWWNGDVDRLTPAARVICAAQGNTLVLSLASIWEIQIKFQLGKLHLGQPLPDIIRSQQQHNGLQLLAIRPEHIYAVGNLPALHRDPFDRLLIAQARTEDMAVLTADPTFRRYGVRLADAP